MKRTILTLLVAGIACLGVVGQTAKGNKALEAKDFAGAKAAFEAALADDPEDAGAHLGLSRYYGASATGQKDNERAMSSLEAAERIFNAADEKGKAKLEKSGVSALTLSERRERIESSFLESAKTLNTIAAYDGFVKRFPNSTYARPAANYRNDLAFKEAMVAGTEDAWNAFINAYPQAESLPEAIATRDRVTAEAAIKVNSVNAYKAFVNNYPDALQAPQIRQRLNALAFEEAKARNTVEAYTAYVNDYPESVFIPQAKEKIEYLNGGVSDD